MWHFRIIALALTFMAFAPFSKVRHVCPRCPLPQGDLIVLMSKARVPCRVIAQNVDYYVIERLHEVRAVMKSEIASIKRKKAETTLSTADQILLKNDVLLHGSIVEEKKGLYYVIKVGAHQHVAWLSQIKSVHRKGARVPAPE
jgi:hypothetical protein